MQIINRIKRAWKLSGFPQALVIDGTKVSAEQLAILKAEPEATVAVVEDPIGDGSGAFFGEPTEEEQLEFEREEEGTKAWYDRLKKLV